jgi:hypothetical protein
VRIAQAGRQLAGQVHLLGAGDAFVPPLKQHDVAVVVLEDAGDPLGPEPAIQAMARWML